MTGTTNLDSTTQTSEHLPPGIVINISTITIVILLTITIAMVILFMCLRKTLNFVKKRGNVHVDTHYSAVGPPTLPIRNENAPENVIQLRRQNVTLIAAENVAYGANVTDLNVDLSTNHLQPTLCRSNPPHGTDV